MNKKAALLIQQWAAHLKKENNNQKQFTEKEIKELFDSISKTRISTAEQLDKIMSNNETVMQAIKIN
jgi:Glu-tRNA(Gln) amidotransferase subunit E-like FAD-binding protein